MLSGGQKRVRDARQLARAQPEKVRLGGLRERRKLSSVARAVERSYVRGANLSRAEM